ncbi:asparaginase [Terrilactibacillus laevilacticus]|uniref:asparaginase n=1 Tax=Terrilactibacillus laevilacticus TaxID=1380157 RepID=UPI0011461C10|nr:asparaginase [Terrilactibacillus laevilacticus]
MKKILLLATGGTIASVTSDDGLVPGLSAEELLHYFQYDQSPLDVTCQILMNRDSTNMQPENWIQIADAISKHYNKFDSFIVTHGTDTLAFTAAALSYMLQGLDKPVILTGSQVPISFKKTDAKKNVQDALRFSQENIGGVFVVFDGRVIIGTRAVKMRTKSYDAFESINHPYVATIDGSSIKYYWTPEKSKEAFHPETNLCTDIFVLKLFPGMNPNIFDFIKEHYKGVIIESFGNGGVPFEGRNLLPKIKELTEAGIVVLISTQCLEEGQDIYLYEVGRKVTNYNILVSGDMNTEASVPKLMWTLGQTDDFKKVKEIIEKPICWDLSPDWEG